MKIGIIGCGSMGKMLIEKLSEAGGIDKVDLFVSSRTKEKAAQLEDLCTVCESNSQLALKSDVIFLCVRPVDLKEVLTEIKDSVKEGALLVSLNGSVRFEQLEKVCKNRFAKAIPSVTAEVSRSQTLVCYNEAATKADKQRLSGILKCIGCVIELPENEMGMGSELVSCMPGFIAAIFNEICISAQKHTTIPRDEIIRMVLNTMMGTSELMMSKSYSFDDVISRVATKGGITEVGAQVIHERFSETADELFEKTLKKREETMLSAQESFGV